MEDLGSRRKNLKVYNKLVNDLRRACSGKEVVRVRDIGDILKTLPEDDPTVVILRCVGSFEGANIDGKFLIVKDTVYVEAVRRENGWFEVNDTHAPIAGAFPLRHRGSYLALGNGGLMVENMRLGFVTLKRAIVSVLMGRQNAADFLTIAVNLCEAARYFFIQDKTAASIGNAEQIPICEYCIFLINGWKKFCSSVEKYQRDGVWVYTGEKQKPEDQRTITRTSVHTIVAMIKSAPNSENKKNQASGSGSGSRY